MEIIKFMEHLDYFYEVIPNIYKNKNYTIHLDKGTWWVNEDEEILFGAESAEDCFSFLQEQKIDVLTFHAFLHSKIGTEAVLRRQQLKVCEELIGLEAIDEQEKVWSDFADQIKDALEKIDRKSKLQVVE